MFSTCNKFGMWLKQHISLLNFNQALVAGPDNAPDESDLHPSSPRGIEARHEVQRYVAQTQHLRPSLTNISPRNVEPSYYESERLYNRSDSSEEGREEVKDECHWPSEGGKYSSLGLEDPRPSDVYEEVRRKHRKKQSRHSIWPLATLFERMLGGQPSKEKSFHKPIITEQHIDDMSMKIYEQSGAFDVLETRIYPASKRTTSRR